MKSPASSAAKLAASKASNASNASNASKASNESTKDATAVPAPVPAQSGSDSASADDEKPVPCNVADHLDQDPVIRGQRYACVSFVSPKDAIACKDVFCVHEFLSKISRDIYEMLKTIEAVFGNKDDTIKETARLLMQRHEHLWDADTMQTEFRLFKEQESLTIDDNFKRAHGAFKTSVQGVKIRGSYDSVEEAQNRAKSLMRIDDRFNVFVAEVGCWCPWDPSTEEIGEVEYNETQLNTLMKKYNEQTESRDGLYNKRKTTLIEQMGDDREAWLERIKNTLVTKQQESGGVEIPSVTMELVNIDEEEAEAHNKLQAERAGQSATAVETESESEPAVESKSVPAVESESEPAVESESEPAVESKSEPAVESKSEPAVESEPEPAAAVESEPEPAAAVESECMCHLYPECVGACVSVSAYASATEDDFEHVASSSASSPA
jgi:gluconate kinase